MLQGRAVCFGMCYIEVTYRILGIGENFISRRLLRNRRERMRDGRGRERKEREALKRAHGFHYRETDRQTKEKYHLCMEYQIMYKIGAVSFL